MINTEKYVFKICVVCAREGPFMNNIECSMDSYMN